MRTFRINPWTIGIDIQWKEGEQEVTIKYVTRHTFALRSEEEAVTKALAFVEAHGRLPSTNPGLVMEGSSTITRTRLRSFPRILEVAKEVYPLIDPVTFTEEKPDPNESLRRK